MKAIGKAAKRKWKALFIAALLSGCSKSGESKIYGDYIEEEESLVLIVRPAGYTFRPGGYVNPPPDSEYVSLQSDGECAQIGDLPIPLIPRQPDQCRGFKFSYKSAEENGHEILTVDVHCLDAPLCDQFDTNALVGSYRFEDRELREFRVGGARPGAVFRRIDPRNSPA